MSKRMRAATSSPDKPAKPYPDFPLFPHATKRWAKKVRGKTRFFGPWRDPQGALDKWLAQKDDLLAGREPRQATEGAITVKFACDAFLTAKKRRVDSRELSPRSFSDYLHTARRLATAFGRQRSVDDLQPADFDALRATMARTLGPVTLGNEVQRIRTIFKYTFDAALIDRPVRFGPDFRRPAKEHVRRERQNAPAREFTAAEVLRLIREAPAPMAAMILLAINCGFGQTDVAELREGQLNWKAAILDYPRRKTAIARRCPLWPETVAALRKAIAARGAPHEEGDADRVFLTAKQGRPWVRVRAPAKADAKRAACLIDAVAQEFMKLLVALKLQRPGRGFYALRHTFRTVADELPDRPAIDRIMGHENAADMRTHYVERIDDARLRAVSNHVRAWLFKRAPKKAVATSAG